MIEKMAEKEIYKAIYKKMVGTFPETEILFFEELDKVVSKYGKEISIGVVSEMEHPDIFKEMVREVICKGDIVKEINIPKNLVVKLITTVEEFKRKEKQVFEPLREHVLELFNLTLGSRI